MEKTSAGDARLLAPDIAGCAACERLAAYCRTFFRPENRKVAGCDYWARPVPGFGDPRGALLIIGLAPGAHGANRTGRPFTGDGAGEVLYRALHRFGFANLPAVTDCRDGLRLQNAYITNAVKCVPPGNRPTGAEKRTCLTWLDKEWDLLAHVRLVLAMGKDAFDSFLRLQKARGAIAKLSDYRFAHGATYGFDGLDATLMATYHFSRYNLNTGVLTEAMVDVLFEAICAFLRKTDRA